MTEKTEQEIRKDEREKLIKALENHNLLSSYVHQTSDGYLHRDWHRSIKSLIHELKSGKI